MSAAYDMDYDWLWAQPPGNDGTTATVRLTVRGADARRVVDAWLDSLPVDSQGLRGEAGWVVERRDAARNRVVVDITSGGEDVADGIYNGTTEAYAALAPAGLDLTWLQLPRGTI